jgi:hypothetical protein
MQFKVVLLRTCTILIDQYIYAREETYIVFYGDTESVSYRYICPFL